MYLNKIDAYLNEIRFYLNEIAVYLNKNEEKHRNKGFRISKQACESSILMHSVPLSRFGIVGAVALQISYLVDILLFR